MLEEIRQNTEIETTSGDYTIPKQEVFNEDGTIDKYKYLLQFPNFTKHERKMTKKKVFKFLEKHSKNKYFRMEIQGSPLGVNFVFTGNFYTSTDRQKQNFFKELWDCIDGTLWEVKNFDFNDENKNSLEIWGITEDGTPTIIYVYPNKHGTIEVKDED